MTNAQMAQQLLMAMDEGVAEQVAGFVARGMSEADARARSLAALRAECDRHRAHDAFMVTLTAD